MRRELIPLLALVTLPFLGCTANQGPSEQTTALTEQSAAPTGDPRVRWVNSFCGVDLELRTALTRSLGTQPTGADTAQLKASYSQSLGEGSTALERAMGTLRELQQSPPEPAAGEVARRTGEALAGVKQSVDGAKVRIDQANPANPQQFQQVVQGVSRDLRQQLDQFRDPTDELRVSRDLERARERAPSCRALDAVRSSAPIPSRAGGSPTSPTPS
ncbi:hypothetical protein LX15_001659 [Streptoalloteichus tenebrarius]|uniref:Lipoprotein n=1 Tax=Streptoalloteichus tenebrarius (strain ATCC 17920 / DSM 40477 / JCM 4838 / CBS 697.72 / NBRC 16177 / NCIMB 11028 / NRRL B-12390 / A12253. 1 / ISP 5477) TaxID=1933 RepID=A0ABT1HR30_STRSD|nr:hypothetical protein [Streptoalloteichus tenebrarius]MCP2257972.1 hypothetical protein [Streptoalloteichus tenebrarius]BFF01637.1 hypothetical protein GCM10020241_33120 [Streptoalloteichus tenebrarius]